MIYEDSLYNLPMIKPFFSLYFDPIKTPLAGTAKGTFLPERLNLVFF
jgi:hypothetical protein